MRIVYELSFLIDLTESEFSDRVLLEVQDMFAFRFEYIIELSRQ